MTQMFAEADNVWIASKDRNEGDFPELLSVRNFGTSIFNALIETF
jgi:hypothetical protein